MNKVGVIFHPHNQAACDLAIELEKHLGASGIDAWLCSAWEGDAARARVEGTDLILTVGGDGTILRAAQAVVPGSTPITGINLGNLGFMTELAADEAFSQLSTLLEGRGWVDERPATACGREWRRAYSLQRGSDSGDRAPCHLRRMWQTRAPARDAASGGR